MELVEVRNKLAERIQDILKADTFDLNSAARINELQFALNLIDELLVSADCLLVNSWYYIVTRTKSGAVVKKVRLISNGVNDKYHRLAFTENLSDSIFDLGRNEIFYQKDRNNLYHTLEAAQRAADHLNRK